MNCQQFETRLNDLLDERAPLELDDALHGHARHCAVCQELWAGYADLVQAMRFRAPPEPSRDLAARIVATAVPHVAHAARVRADGHASRVSHALTGHVVGSLRDPSSGHGVTGPHSTRHIWWRAAVITAAAAVLVAVCWRFNPPNNNAPAPQGNVAQTGSPTPGPRAFSDLALDAANCYAGLARETRSELSDVLALVPRVDDTPAVVLWPSGEPGPAPEVASHVREGLRPLAQSTLSALTSLFGGTTPENGDL